MATKKLVGKPRGKQASFEDRKAEVVLAAAKLFNKNGYHNTTMDDVAAELKVTKPALYYYARSKDEILFEVLKVAMEQGAIIQAATTDSDMTGLQCVEHYFREWTKVVCNDYGRCLVLTQPTSLGSKTRKRDNSARRAANNRIRAHLEAGMADGSIRPCDPKLMASALFDLFNGVAHWYDPKGDYTPDEIAERYWTMVSGGLAAE
jgi:AcrR family transcriptional regulator